MKTAVAYYSLGGTTRSYARAEAKARNADLIAVSYTHLTLPTILRV